MAALEAAIHPDHSRTDVRGIDGRVKPGHDEVMFQPAIYCAPFTVMVAPVIKAASSPARKQVILAISSALPRRPTGIVAMMPCSTFSGTACTISVSMYPGQITFTVMPFLAVSCANALVKPMMPALAAE